MMIEVHLGVVLMGRHVGGALQHGMSPLKQILNVTLKVDLRLYFIKGRYLLVIQQRLPGPSPVVHGQYVDRVQESIARRLLRIDSLARPGPSESHDLAIGLGLVNDHVVTRVSQDVLPHPMTARYVLLREVVLGEQLRVRLLPRRDVNVGDCGGLGRKRFPDRERHAPMLSKLATLDRDVQMDPRRLVIRETDNSDQNPQDGCSNRSEMSTHVRRFQGDCVSLV